MTQQHHATCEIKGATSPEYLEILTAQAQEFLAALATKFAVVRPSSPPEQDLEIVRSVWSIRVPEHLHQHLHSIWGATDLSAARGAPRRTANSRRMAEVPGRWQLGNSVGEWSALSTNW